jgi:hypothetical protein
MNLAIFQKGRKFFLRDLDTGQIMGKKSGYASRKEAQTALNALSAGSSLPKFPQPGVGSPAPGGAMGAMTPGMMQSPPSGTPSPSGSPQLSALMGLLRSKGQK